MKKPAGMAVITHKNVVSLIMHIFAKNSKKILIRMAKMRNQACKTEVYHVSQNVNMKFLECHSVKNKRKMPYFGKNSFENEFFAR